MSFVMTIDNIELTDEFVITKQFRNANDFSLFIEEKARNSKLNYLDIVLDYCKENDIDPESLKTLINPQLKDKIRIDAEESNLMKRRGKLVF